MKESWQRGQSSITVQQEIARRQQQQAHKEQALRGVGRTPSPRTTSQFDQSQQQGYFGPSAPTQQQQQQPQQQQQQQQQYLQQQYLQQQYSQQQQHQQQQRTPDAYQSQYFGRN